MKIKFKIALSFIALIICFGIVNTAVFLNSEYKSQIANYKITGTSIVKNVEPYVADLLYVNDYVGLQRIINGIRESNPDILYAFILNAENGVVVHTFLRNFPADLLQVNVKPVHNVELLESEDHTIYDFSYPVVDGKLGIIRLGLSRERLIQTMKQDMMNRLFLLLVFVLLGAGTALYISKLLSDPLSELVDSVETIAGGDFKHRISVRSNDEIGALSGSFNAMCRSLEKLTDSLEEKIEMLNQKNNEYLALNEEYEAQNENLLRAKERAEESDRLKTVFLANLSHEIRTPMSGILGFAELLKTRKLSEAKQKEYLSIIEQSGHRMLKLITDLVDISKIEAGQVELKKDQINLNQLLDKMYIFFMPQAMKKGIFLDYEKTLSDKECMLETDGLKLEQIFTNLINNALKFTWAGIVQFGYQIRENTVLCWVKDTGIGIPSEMKELVFERFRKVNDDHLNNEEGSGLGLAICKAFVELMGGHIWVESERGRGSVFYFALPYDKAIEKTIVSGQVNQWPDYCNNVTVLVAEDDEMSFTLLNEILKNHRINTLHASNGKEAVDYVKKEKGIVLILMDLKMPIMNGIDATQEIRKNNRHIPIIAQTAYTSDFDKRRAAMAGCTDFITKPVTENELMSKIFQALK